MRSFRFLIVAFLLIVFQPFTVDAQKIAYVDSEYILEQMPDYRSAQKQLDDAADQWKKDMQSKKEEITKLTTALEAEYILLPDDVKKKREEEILTKQKDYDAYKKEKFGADGELFKKRTTLLKPIQDKVFEAIQKLANENKYDIVFDKAGAITMLYSNAKYDRSDEVLEILGINLTAPTDTKKKVLGDKLDQKINNLLKDDKDEKKDPKKK